jgi:hypothetical protein
MAQFTRCTHCGGYGKSRIVWEFFGREGVKGPAGAFLSVCKEHDSAPIPPKPKPARGPTPEPSGELFK